MTLFQKTGNELFQNLGKLFYVVALADKNVHPIEVERNFRKP